MPNYDPKLLTDLAVKLQRGTKRLVLVFTLMGALMGAVVGSYIYMATGGTATKSVALWTVLLAVFGYVTGRQKAFSMTVKAQEILCDVQIEENTRPKAMSATAD